MLIVDIQKKLSHFPINVHFEVKNEVVVLFGPSGSGKTTILNCIAGMSTPDKGKISLRDVIFYEDGKKVMLIRKRKIGYLFQDHALFPHMTVAHNIMYGTKERGWTLQSPLIQQLLQDLGIEHLLTQLPQYISGGEKQRVALARALATEPEVLLLDEPFSSLDQETRLQCHDMLLRLRERWSIPTILVTHDRDEANKLGNRMIRLERGIVVTNE